MLRVSNQSSVLQLQVYRPDARNALSVDLLKQIASTLRTEVNDSVRAVILTGGTGYFSAGADLRDLEGDARDQQVDDAIDDAVSAIAATSVPVIAAVEGFCLGAAVDLSLACDLRIASTGAFFQVPATRLGLLYNPESVVRWAQHYPRDVLFRLLVLGERLNAQEALRCGLLSRLAEPGETLGEAQALAQLAEHNDSAAMTASKQMLNAIFVGTYDAEYWQVQRRMRLNSPERRSALLKAKQKLHE